MGKGKGKKGRKEAKLAAKKDTEESKISGIPGAKPLKKPTKVSSGDKKSVINNNLPGTAAYPVLMDRPKPFTKNPQHAKWPALFKKHLGVIESHIRSLDRVMQSMRSQMNQMEEKEKLEWELGERGNWRVICEMMDRAREVLASAREAAKGILPPQNLKDKKGLGVVGTSFEPLGPQLKRKAAELGYDAKGKGKLGRNPDEVDSDLDTISSSSDSDTNSDSSDSGSSEEEEKDDEEAETGSVTAGDDFVSLNVGAKLPRLNGTTGEEPTSNGAVELNPYFVIDTKPTPINLRFISNNDQSKTKTKLKETKSEKKLRLAAEREAKKAARRAMGEQRRKEHQERERAAAEAAAKITAAAEARQPPETAPTKSSAVEVDFSILEAKLQAEIAASTKEKSESEMKKKRRRSSGGFDEVKTKKVKKEVVAEEATPKKIKKRKAEEDEVENVETEVAGKKKLKKDRMKRRGQENSSEEKKATRERKRKAGSEDPVDEGKKKKQKHKREEEL